MLNQHSLEELLIFHNLLEISKKEYEEGIKPILIKNSPARFRKSSYCFKIKKKFRLTGLGLAAQNTNILKKNIEEFENYGQKPLITRSKKKLLLGLKFVRIWN
jgi:ribosomal protein L5